MSFTEVLIELPHTKPGEDLNNCMITDADDYVNVKQTLTNMINLLKLSLKQLEDINKLIPENNTLDIYGSGQKIGLCGDNEVLEKLLDEGLVVEGTFEESSDDATPVLSYSDDDDSNSHEDCYYRNDLSE